MGYWNMKGEQSALFVEVPEEEITGVWGDRPADTIVYAIVEIVAQFEVDLGRRPTKQEIRNGLMFALNSMDSLKD
jgi:hypothetical protein